MDHHAYIFFLLILPCVLGLNLTTDFFTISERLALVSTNKSIQICFDSPKEPISKFVVPSQWFPLVSTSTLSACMLISGESFASSSRYPIAWISPPKSPLFFHITATSGSISLSKLFASYGSKIAALPPLSASPRVLCPSLIKARGVSFAFTLTPVPPVLFECELSLLFLNGKDSGYTVGSRVASTRKNSCVFPSGLLQELVELGLGYTMDQYHLLLEIKSETGLVLGWTQISLIKDLNIVRVNTIALKSQEPALIYFSLSSPAHLAINDLHCVCRTTTLGKTFASLELQIDNTDQKGLTAYFPPATFPPSTSLNCSLWLDEIPLPSQSQQLIHVYSELELKGETSFAHVGRDNQTISLEIYTDLPNAEQVLVCMIDNISKLPAEVSLGKNGLYIVKCDAPTVDRPTNLSVGLRIDQTDYVLVPSYPVLPLFILNSYQFRFAQSSLWLNLTEVYSFSGAAMPCVCAISLGTYGVQRVAGEFDGFDTISCKEVFIEKTGDKEWVWIEDASGRNLTHNSLNIRFSTQINPSSSLPSVALLGKRFTIYAQRQQRTSPLKLCFKADTSAYSLECTGQNSEYNCPTPPQESIYKVFMAESCADYAPANAKIMWVTKGISITQKEPNILSVAPAVSLKISSSTPIMPNKLICVLNHDLIADLSDEYACNFDIAEIKETPATLYLASKESPSVVLSNTLQYTVLYPVTITSAAPFVRDSFPITLLYNIQQLGTNWISSLAGEIVCSFSDSILQPIRILNHTHLECAVPDIILTQHIVNLGLVYHNKHISNTVSLAVLKFSASKRFDVRAISSDQPGIVVPVDGYVFSNYTDCHYFNQNTSYSISGIYEASGEVFCSFPYTDSSYAIYTLQVLMAETELTRIQTLILFNKEYLCSLLPHTFSILVDAATTSSIESINFNFPWDQHVPAYVQIAGLGVFPIDSSLNIPLPFGQEYEYTLLLDSEEIKCNPRPKLRIHAISLAINKVEPSIVFVGERTKISLQLIEEIPEKLTPLSVCCDGNCMYGTLEQNKTITSIILAQDAQRSYMECFLSTDAFPKLTKERFYVRTVKAPAILSVSPQAVYMKHPVHFVINLKEPIIGVEKIYCTNGMNRVEASIVSPGILNCTLPATLSPGEFYIGIQYEELPARFFASSILSIDPPTILSTNTTLLFQDGSPTYISALLSTAPVQKLLCIFDYTFYSPAVPIPGTNEIVCIHQFFVNNSYVHLSLGVSDQHLLSPILLNAVPRPFLHGVSPNNFYSAKPQILFALFGENLSEISKVRLTQKKPGTLNLLLPVTLKSASEVTVSVGELPEGIYEISLGDPSHIFTNPVFVYVLSLPNVVTVAPAKEFVLQNVAIKVQFDEPLLAHLEYSCVFASKNRYSAPASVVSNIVTCEIPYELISVEDEEKYTLGVMLGVATVWTEPVTLYPYRELKFVSPEKVSANGGSVVRMKASLNFGAVEHYAKVQCQNGDVKVVAANRSEDSTELVFNTPPIQLEQNNPESCEILLSVNGITYIPTELSLKVYPPIQIHSLSPAAGYANQESVIYVKGAFPPQESGTCKITEFTPNNLNVTHLVPLVPINNTVCICKFKSTLPYEHNGTLEISRNSVDFTHYSALITIYAAAPKVFSVKLMNHFTALESSIIIHGRNLHSYVLCEVECSGFKSVAISEGEFAVCYRPSINHSFDTCGITLLDTITGTTIGRYQMLLQPLPVIISMGPMAGFSGQVNYFTIRLGDLYTYPLTISAKLGNTNFAHCESLTPSYYNCSVEISETGTFPVSLSYNNSASLVLTSYSYRSIPKPEISSISPRAFLCGTNDVSMHIFGENLSFPSFTECKLNTYLKSDSIATVNETHLICHFPSIPQRICTEPFGLLSLKAFEGLWTFPKHVSLIKSPAVLSITPSHFPQKTQFNLTIFFALNSLFPGLEYECAMANAKTYPAINFANSVLQCSITDNFYQPELEIFLRIEGHKFLIGKIYGGQENLNLVSVHPKVAYKDSNITLKSVWDTTISNFACFSDDLTELPSAYSSRHSVTVNLLEVAPGYHTIKCSQALGSFSNPIQVYVLNPPLVHSVTSMFIKGVDTSFTINGEGFIAQKTLVKLNEILQSACVAKNSTFILCDGSQINDLMDDDYTVYVSTNNGDQWVDFHGSRIISQPIVRSVKPSRMALGIENVLLVTFSSTVNGLDMSFWIRGQRVEKAALVSNNSVLIKARLTTPILSASALECSLNEGTSKFVVSSELTFIDTPPKIFTKEILVIESQQATLHIEGKNLDLLYKARCQFLPSGRNEDAVLVNKEELICPMLKERETLLLVKSENVEQFEPIKLISIHSPTLLKLNATTIYSNAPNYIELEGSYFLYRTALLPYYSCYLSTSFGLYTTAGIVSGNSKCGENINSTPYCIGSRMVCAFPSIEYTKTPATIYIGSESIMSNIVTLPFYTTPTLLQVTPTNLVRGNNKLRVLYNSSRTLDKVLCVLNSTSTGIIHTAKASFEQASDNTLLCDWDNLISGTYQFSLVTPDGMTSIPYPKWINVLGNELSVSSVILTEWTSYMASVTLTLHGLNFIPDLAYLVEVNNQVFFNASYMSPTRLNCTILFDHSIKDENELKLNVYANKARITENEFIIHKAVDVAFVDPEIIILGTSQALVVHGSRMNAVKMCKFGIALSTAYASPDGSIKCSIPEGLKAVDPYVDLLSGYGEVLQRVTGVFSQELSYVCNVGTDQYSATIISPTLVKCIDVDMLYLPVSISVKNVNNAVSESLLLSRSAAVVAERFKTPVTVPWVLIDSLYELPDVASDLACEFEYDTMNILTEAKQCDSFNGADIVLYSEWKSTCCKVPAIKGAAVNLFLVSNKNWYSKVHVATIEKVTEFPISSVSRSVFSATTGQIQIYGDSYTETPLHFACRIDSVKASSCFYQGNVLTFIADKTTVLNKFPTNANLYASQNPKYGRRYANILVTIRERTGKTISLSPNTVFMSELPLDLTFFADSLEFTLGYRILLGSTMLPCRTVDKFITCSLEKPMKVLGIYPISVEVPGGLVVKQNVSLAVFDHCKIEVVQSRVKYGEDVLIDVYEYQQDLYAGKLYCSFNNKYMTSTTILKENRMIARISCPVIHQGENEDQIAFEVFYVNQAGYKERLYKKSLEVEKDTKELELYPSVARKHTKSTFIIAVDSNKTSPISLLINSNTFTPTRVSKGVYQFAYTCNRDIVQVVIQSSTHTIGTKFIQCISEDSIIDSVEYLYNKTALQLFVKLNDTLSALITTSRSNKVFSVLNNTFMSQPCYFNTQSSMFVCDYARTSSFNEGRTALSLSLQQKLYNESVSNLLVTREYEFTFSLPLQILNLKPLMSYPDTPVNLYLELLSANFINDLYCLLVSNSTVSVKAVPALHTKSVTCDFSARQLSPGEHQAYLVSPNNLQQLSNPQSFTVLPEQVINPQKTYVKLVNDTMSAVQLQLNYIRSDLPIDCAWVLAPSQVVSANTLITTGTILSIGNDSSEVNCTVPDRISIGKYEVKISQTSKTSWTGTYQMVEVLKNVEAKTVSPAVTSLYSGDPITVYGDFSSFSYACKVATNCSCTIGISINTRIGEILEDRIVLWVEGKNSKTIAGVTGNIYSIFLYVGQARIQPNNPPTIAIYSDDGIANIRPSRIFSFESTFIYIRLQRSLSPAVINSTNLVCAIYKDLSLGPIQPQATILNSTFIKCQVPVLSPGIYYVDVVVLAPNKGLMGTGMVSIEPEIVITDIEPAMGPRSGGSYLNLSCTGLEELAHEPQLMLYCMFNNSNYWSQAVVYNNYQVRCMTPRLSTGKAQVWLVSGLSPDDNGRSAIFVHSGPVSFYLQPDLTITSMYPKAALLGTETMIHFGVDYSGDFISSINCRILCKKDGLVTYAPAVMMDKTIQCNFLPYKKSDYAVSIASGNIEYTEQFSITVHERISIVSSNGTDSYFFGGRTVNLLATNIAPSSKLICEFVDKVKMNKVPAEIVAVKGLHLVKCLSPAGESSTKLHLYDQTMQAYSSNAIIVNYVDPPYVTRIEPQVIYLDGKDAVLTVKGAKLKNTYLHLEHRNIVLQSINSTDIEAWFVLNTKYMSEAVMSKWTVSHYPDYANSGAGGYIQFANLPRLSLIANTPLHTQSKELLLSGENLDRIIACKLFYQGTTSTTLKATIINGTAILCVSTQNFGTLFGPREIQVSVMAESLPLDSVSPLTAKIHELPTIYKIIPSHGPITGGYSVTLLLDVPTNLTSYLCMIDDTSTGPALKLGPDRFTCKISARNTVGAAKVWLLAAEYYLESLVNFTFTPALRISSVSPDYIAVDSKEFMVKVQGRGFLPNSQELQCVLRATRNCAPHCPLSGTGLVGEATVSSDEVLTCTFKADTGAVFQRIGNAELSLAIEGVDVAYSPNSPRLIHVFKQPNIMFSELVKVGENYYISLKGVNFMQHPGLFLSCYAWAFYASNTAKGIIGTYVGSDIEGKCALEMLDTHPEITAFTFSLWFNEKFQCTGNYTLHSPSLGMVTSASSLQVTVGNFTKLTFAGSFLKHSVAYTCWFDSFPVIAEFVSPFLIACTAPDLPVGDHDLKITANATTTLFEQILQYVSELALSNVATDQKDWIVVEGTGFSTNCTCVFDDSLPSSLVKVLSESIMECRLPSEWMLDPAKSTFSVTVQCGSTSVSTSISRVPIFASDLLISPTLLRENTDYTAITIFINRTFNIDPTLHPLTCGYTCDSYEYLPAEAGLVSPQTLNCTIPYTLFNHFNSECTLHLTIGETKYALDPNITILGMLRIESVSPNVAYRGAGFSSIFRGGVYMKESQYTCALKESTIMAKGIYLNESAISCTFPEIDIEGDKLTLVLREGILKAEENIQVSNEYMISLLDDAEILGVDPFFVPMDSGYLLTITGTNFIADKTFVIFSDSIQISATVVSPNTLQVFAPVFHYRAPTTIPVSVTTHPSIPNKAKAIRLHLINLPVLRGANLTTLHIGQVEPVSVTGENFTEGEDIHTCKWSWDTSSTETKATFVSANYLMCPTPSTLPESMVQLSIGSKGTYYSQQSIEVSVIAPLSVVKIEPSVVSRTGGTLIKVYLNKEPPSTLYCKIGENVDSAILLDSETRVIGCKAPFMRSLGDYALEVMQDSGKFTNTGAILQVTEEAVFKSVYPALGPAEGGSNLTISGSGFQASVTYKCVFSIWDDGRVKEFSSTATRQDSGKLYCVTPKVSLVSVFTKLTINGSNGETAVGSGLFYHYQKPSIISMYPKAGVMTGGTRVTITGSGFFKFLSISCKFGISSPVIASVVQEDSIISCKSPPYQT